MVNVKLVKQDILMIFVVKNAMSIVKIIYVIQELENVMNVKMDIMEICVIAKLIYQIV